MAFFNKDIAKESILHAKKQAWNSFINNGGHENATVLYWIGQLPACEKAQLKQAMKDYCLTTIEQGE